MKTSKFSLIIFLCLMISLLSGCRSLYYAPNAQNVPMFKEKNEVRLSSAYSLSSDASETNKIEGLEIQGAYAAGKHFAIIANGYFARSIEGNDEYEVGTWKQNGNLVECGAGYFKPFSNNRLVGEVYGGFGGGKISNRYIDEYDPTLNKASSVNFKRYFVQPSIGYSASYWAVAFSLRFALLTYDHKPEIGLGTSYVLAEPCFTIRSGFKGLKIQSQIQFSNNITDPGFPQHHFQFNTGLCLTLPVKKSIE
jgi:hypothetical protein